MREALAPVTRSNLNRAMAFQVVAPSDANARTSLGHFFEVLALKHQWLIKLKFAPDFKVDRAAYPYKPDGILMASMLNLCEQIVAYYPTHFWGMNACQVFAGIWREKAEGVAHNASAGEIVPLSELLGEEKRRVAAAQKFFQAEPGFTFDLEEDELPSGIFARLVTLTLIHIRHQRAAALAATGGKSSRNEFELKYWENRSRKAVANIVSAGGIPPFVNARQSARKHLRDNPKRQAMRSRITDTHIELGRNVGGRGRGFAALSKVERPRQPDL